MRLAVIADIHGNQDALDAVLADVRAQGADRLYVNGDVVNRGPDSVSCLNTVLALPQDELAGLTLGNHDDLMLLWHDRSHALPGEWFDDPFWGATDWSARQLNAAGLLNPLRRWPLTVHIEDVGPPVLLAHGSPTHYREALGQFTTDERAAALLDEAGVNVLVASHIHRSMVRLLGQRWFINTGAVGAPFDGDPAARYLQLDLHGGAWVPTIRHVPYDRRGVLERFISSGLLEAGGVSAEIFRLELQTARSLYTPFWDWTEQGGGRRDWDGWRHFLSLHQELLQPQS
ncbi:metallophosphoesterase family protein [Deinococcus sonorensis]|uniref:Metallophosphoesterase n=2 Tax=Deinococcus sonorensis TaxID=309891 RepID=A0AAU7U8E1_9DEIO